MELETLRWDKTDGWSVKEFPNLDSENTAVLIFGYSEMSGNEKPLQELIKHYKKSHIVGCSSAGEIFNTHVSDDSMSVAIVKFNKTRLAKAIGAVAQPKMSFSAGEQLGLELLKPDLSGILLLSDGVNVNGSELVYGINSVLPDSVVVTGGLAGDGDRFKKTWTIQDGKLSKNMVVALGFYGKDFLIGHGSEGGWDIFGPIRKVTRAEGNVLYEIDDQPALKLYKDYLGDRATELPAAALLFPLALLRDEEDSGYPIVRTILSVNEEEKSMTFAGDIPEGTSVQLMRCSFERLVMGATHAAESAAQESFFSENNGRPTLAITISCVGRRLIMGQKTDDELEASLSKLPAGTKQVGFYSYGEISPYKTGYCDLHNQTMTLTLLSEK